MDALRAFCASQYEWAVATLEALARVESPSDDKTAVDRCGAALRALLEGAGARVEVLPRETAGDHLRAEFGDGPARVLVLAHFDTVWPLGQIATMPVEQRGGCLYGPGVYDMKGGIVVALLALRALYGRGGAPPARVVFLLTTDEEIGSDTSRTVIEDEALRSDAVLVLEPSLPGGAVKTGRKGVGEFTLEVTGVSAHAGADIARGASAIVEMAHQVLAMQHLQDPARGLTLNVGVIDGGTRSNVVAARAAAEIDVRITRVEDGPRIEAALAALAPIVPGTRLALRGRINRPPMERSAGVARLYELVRRVGARMGLDVGEGSTGGASDGNFTAALGIPTIDGLGVIGDGAHALHEHVRLDAITDRASLVAGLIAEIAAEAPSWPRAAGAAPRA